MSREISFKYVLLRGGAYCALLRAREDQPPHKRMNDSAEITSSFTGIFAPAAVDADGNTVEIDWISDEIQPVEVIDGVGHALGVFMPATVQEIDDGVTKSVRVEAYDRAWRVKDSNSEGLLYFAAGTLYTDAVGQLLSAAGIETVFTTPCDAVLAEAREWDAGVSRLSVANELLREINYNPVWFDESGAAVLEPVSVPEASAIEHTLDIGDPETMVLPEISRETDIYGAANVFIVTCANPDKTGNMSATAVNNNPQSPLSVSRRGRRICAHVRVDNIADQDALQAYADRLRDESMITGETIQVATGLTPGFGPGDVVGLVYPIRAVTEDGEEIRALEPGICIERAYDMELCVGGKMTHTMERIVYNLD